MLTDLCYLHNYNLEYILDARSELIKSNLPTAVLNKLWKLADIDEDNLLDNEEFSIVMHLINIKTAEGAYTNEIQDQHSSSKEK